MKNLELNKTVYVSPSLKTIEVKAQAIICLSADNEDYENVSNPNWFEEKE